MEGRTISIEKAYKSIATLYELEAGQGVRVMRRRGQSNLLKYPRREKRHSANR